MKILLLIPVINKEYIPNAYSFIKMNRMGAKIKIICRRYRTGKGTGLDPAYENMEGIGIHRIYDNAKEQYSFPLKKCHMVYEIVRKFQPDAILCSLQQNMPLAIKLKENFNIPIVLLLEYAYNPNKPFNVLPINGEKYIKNKSIGKFLEVVYWRWLCKHSSAIITSCYGDKANFDYLAKYRIPLYYVPWPSYPAVNPSNIKKIRKRGIFIGSFAKHKNLTEFKTTIPRIFEETSTGEFYVIGDGIDKEIVTDLKSKYPKEIKYIASIPRKKALELIASSFYAYSPVLYGGWGFIADTWSMKTPLIATHNHNNFEDNTDAILAKPSNIAEKINQLYENASFYRILQRGGYERFKKDHHAEAVGKHYYRIIERILREKQ